LGEEPPVSIREEEMEAAAQALGISDVTVFDYRDQFLDQADAREAIRQIVCHVRCRRGC